MTEIDRSHMRERLGSEDGAAPLAHASHKLLFGLRESRGDGGDAALEGATLGGLQKRGREREGGNDGDGEGVLQIGGREGSQSVVGVLWVRERRERDSPATYPCRTRRSGK